MYTFESEPYQIGEDTSKNIVFVINDAGVRVASYVEGQEEVHNAARPDLQ